MNRFSPGAPAPSAADRLLPWRRVKDLAGISRSTAWRLQKAGRFPKPVQISPGRVGWWESEVSAWREGLAPRVDCGAPASPYRRATASSATLFGGHAPLPLAAPVQPTGRPRPPRRRRAVPACDQLSFDF